MLKNNRRSLKQQQNKQYFKEIILKFEFKKNGYGYK